MIYSVFIFALTGYRSKPVFSRSYLHYIIVNIIELPMIKPPRGLNHNYKKLNGQRSMMKSIMLSTLRWTRLLLPQTIKFLSPFVHFFTVIIHMKLKNSARYSTLQKREARLDMHPLRYHKWCFFLLWKYEVSFQKGFPRNKLMHNLTFISFRHNVMSFIKGFLPYLFWIYVPILILTFGNKTFNDLSVHKI